MSQEHLVSTTETAPPPKPKAVVRPGDRIFSGAALGAGILILLVLAGVATDCCVISTALAAADAGAWVEVASDACAGSTPGHHQAAMTVMGLYAPQIRLRSVDEILADRTPA